MHTPRPVLLAALLVALVLPAAAADASCLFDDRPVEDRIGEFPYVFKGTVTELRDEDRTARFDIEEVWVGELAEDVVVFGGPVQDGGPGEVVATSNDRTWQADTTYLVLAQVEDRGLVDNACSPTRVWSDDLALARPADWREPDPTLAAAEAEDDTSTGIGPLGTTGLVVLLGAALVGVVVLARRRAGAA